VSGVLEKPRRIYDATLALVGLVALLKLMRL
jgi:hypothetical protein